MILDDSGLSNFGLGLAPAAAVFVAISVAVLVFVLDRRSQDEVEAFRRVRRSADALHRFLVQRKESSGNYVIKLASYLDFAREISTISVLNAPQDSPGFLAWRCKTVEVTRKAQSVAAKIRGATLLSLKEEPVTLNWSEFDFHAKFGDLMQALDDAIQDLDWASGTRQQGVRQTLSFAALGGLLVTVSLAIGLAAEVRSGGGIPDGVNLYFALLLLISLSAALLFFPYVLSPALMTRQQWISGLSRHATSAPPAPPKP